MSDDNIIEIPIAGRTIVRASAWADGDNLSILLDDGNILQIHATDDTVKWHIEEKPE
jgi:hypothetical protein